jgi:RNA polymerase primary sigma factor
MTSAPFVSNDEPDVLDRYLMEMGEKKMLTVEEELALGKVVYDSIDEILAACLDILCRTSDSKAAEATALCEKWLRDSHRAKQTVEEVLEFTEMAARDFAAELAGCEGVVELIAGIDSAKDRLVEAHKKLVEGNLRLVVSFAKSYKGHNFSLMDIIQEGNIGLMKAAFRFDYSMGFKFCTLASYWIRQTINRAILDKSRTVRLPVHVHELRRLVTNAQDDARKELGREPTVEEIAYLGGFTLKQVNTAFSVCDEAISLDHPVSDSVNADLSSIIPDENALSADDEVALQQLKKNIAQVMEKLDSRERHILTRRMGLDGGDEATLGEIGEEIGVTRERVRQILNTIFGKLRHPAIKRLLTEFA